jgi:hypothetical protein
MRSFTASNASRRFCKAALFTVSVGGASILLGGAKSFSQDAPTVSDPAYEACASDMEHAPQNAYDSCAQYVHDSASGNSENIQKAKDWLATHAVYRPYVRYVQSLTPDDKAKFIVYEPDMTIELPNVDEHDDFGTVKIARKFDNLTEEGLLRKAEAVYPGPSEMLRLFFVNWAGWPFGQNGPMEPFWGVPVKGEHNASVVTARAVRYYYDERQDYTKSPKLGPIAEVSRITLGYDGVIRHFDRFAHVGASFEDVYVADMTLVWDFQCGGLCGRGFKRNKVVVLNRHGDVISLFMDAPENGEMTFY